MSAQQRLQALGCPEDSIAPGAAWEDIPEDLECMVGKELVFRVMTPPYIIQSFGSTSNAALAAHPMGKPSD